jgi:hypothetical protein
MTRNNSLRWEYWCGTTPVLLRHKFTKLPVVFNKVDLKVSTYLVTNWYHWRLSQACWWWFYYNICENITSLEGCPKNTWVLISPAYCWHHCNTHHHRVTLIVSIHIQTYLTIYDTDVNALSLVLVLSLVSLEGPTSIVHSNSNTSMVLSQRAWICNQRLVVILNYISV